jgi:hypothetical protein
MRRARFPSSQAWVRYEFADNAIFISCYDDALCWLQANIGPRSFQGVQLCGTRKTIHSQNRATGIRCSGCTESLGQKMQVLPLFRARKENGPLARANLCNGAQKRTRSHRRDPGIRCIGCLSSPGAKHAGVSLVPGTKRKWPACASQFM